ncbi:ribosomal protection-like ABC-F family protein [Clostridium senegalense]|uniref:ribosomal protection-like ABC-F family protein n=1 Tax=Clostridium senegalense TaxID=1465809 RepID=UPI001C11D717|nr:ABC-F family ATP-binding cassette domain-containing protein [Clostridium senegalense]MBU5227092.1 ABC-F family ATP-binding cassette domain-containing protein [Clostridium senegalense]
MIELSFNKVKKYLDATLVLEDVTFNIYDGEKVGIVGANGCGKSTVLKLIAGIFTMTRDDKGLITIPKNYTISYLDQIPNYDEDVKVIDILSLAFSELKEIEVTMKSLEIKMKTLEGEILNRTLKEYSYLQDKYTAKGGFEQKEKLSKVCKGLNFNDDFLKKDFNILSGGEKTTVILGKILLDSPDILLLDEPTNHLDMESVEWLEGYLKSYNGIVIIVSHDRYFLDNVVNKIIEIEDGVCETYKGNYSDFVKQKEENMLIQFNQFKEQQKKIDAMEKAIKDLRDWALRADNNKFFRRAASMQKSLDKMERIDKPKLERKNMTLNFKDSERSGNEVIKSKNLCKSYDDKTLFYNGNMLVRFKERTALIGSNGSGKTTFLKILLDKENLDAGEVTISESAKVAYLPQSIRFNDENMTVIECFREDISILEGKAREYLSKFMFFGSDVFKKVKHLSGGEKIRLKLSMLLYDDINLLILDEPTNHLDIDSIENLEESLRDFKGTIFFISHDRYFINRIANRIIAIENNSFESYDGNYDAYKEEKSKFNIQIEENKKSKPERKNWKNINTKKVLEKKIFKLETIILENEKKIEHLNNEMEENSSDYFKIMELNILKENVEKSLQEFIEQWELHWEELNEYLDKNNC